MDQPMDKYLQEWVKKSLETHLKKLNENKKKYNCIELQKIIKNIENNMKSSENMNHYLKADYNFYKYWYNRYCGNVKC